MNQEDIQIDLNENRVELEPRQREIYKGLKNIGEEIAAFYLDGIKISNSNELETKSYLLAHIAREIECGLRDILVPNDKDVERCKECGQTIKKVRHIDSICNALEVDKKDSLAKRWHKIAKKFHKYAHRHGSWREPREKSEFENLWKEFEKILFRLVGTYYNLLDRIDRILGYERPSKDILGTLSNLLKVEARYFYFFRNLQYSSWLKPLKEKGYFNPENNPKPQEDYDQPGFYIIPYWSVLDYLEKVAKKNMEELSDEVTSTLVEIVDGIISYKDENDERIENYRTDWVMLKIISTFPVEQIGRQHIEFIRNALKSKWDTTLVASEIGKTFIPKLINDIAKSLLLQLFNVILDYQKQEEQAISEKYVSIIDRYWLSDALKKNKSGIAKLCGIEAVDIAISKIKSIIKEDNLQFNKIWIPTVEEHPQATPSTRYERQLVCFVRDMFEQTNPAKIEDKTKTFLKENHPIFRRIAVHTINHHFSELGEIFWNLPKNPFDDFGIDHELYKLLKSNSNSFGEKQIDQVLKWIDTKDYSIHFGENDTEEEKKRTVASHKKGWLSALLDTNNAKVIERYKECEKITSEEKEHPGFNIVWTKGHKSPIDADKLCSMPNPEIAEYLTNFKERKDSVDSPTEEGLSDAFKDCVSNNPEKFSRDLEPFQNVHRMYQNPLLRGLWEAWRAKKSFEWDKPFGFMLNIIKPESFWKEKYVTKRKNQVTSAIAETGHYNYHNWVISSIADLIKEGTKDDDHAFDPKLLPKAEKILLILVEKTESNLSEMNNLLTAVLNSPKGQILSAMVNYSLRYARLPRKDEDDRWVKSVKRDFDKRLDREIEPALEFSVILGQYLANLYYLDKRWVIDNINKIFPKYNDAHWEAAFTGYLFHSKVYEVIYSLLRRNGHYVKALETDFPNKQVKKHLVQHICMGYIEGWEKLDDETSLISELIENRDTTQLSEIVRFFWTLRNKLTEKIKAKVKPLWEVLFEIISQNTEKEKYQEIISRLSEWLSLIDEIDDEILGWLKLSAKHIEKYGNASFFVESLRSHVEQTPKEVGEIYLEMLNSEVYPRYDKKDIEGIVQVLYEKDQKEVADMICNMYGERNYNFLRKLYEKHKSL